MKRLTESCLLVMSFLLLVTGTNAIAHQSNLNQIPWKACEQKRLNDACEFRNSKEDVYRGSCQSMSEVLMCVRNQPIEYSLKNAQDKTSDDHDNNDHTH